MPEAAAAHPAGTVGHAEHVMGTVVSFTVRLAGLAERDVRAAIGAACAGLHEADRVFSTWDPGSPVSRLRGGAAALADMPAEVPEVLALCERARALSRGWFDPWAMPGGVDPTGLVKGWAVERAAATLRAAGVGAALVNAGGDLIAFGEPEPGQPWRAGVRHPWRPDALACVLAVHGAVATSGSYERGSHLIDPFHGQAARGVASATVTGPSLALADALATALAVGADDALTAVADAAGYQGYLIRADGTEADTGGVAFIPGDQADGPGQA